MKLDPDIHNAYESMVSLHVEELRLSPDYSDYSEDFIADLCCIALNYLPTHYIRHSVDNSFHIDDMERERMGMRVDEAVQKALARLLHDRRNQNTRDE